jgi:hypothetical protein
MAHYRCSSLLWFLFMFQASGLYALDLAGPCVHGIASAVCPADLCLQSMCTLANGRVRSVAARVGTCDIVLIACAKFVVHEQTTLQMAMGNQAGVDEACLGFLTCKLCIDRHHWHQP